MQGDLENVMASISFIDSVLDIQELVLETGREPGRFLLPAGQRCCRPRNDAMQAFWGPCIDHQTMWQIVPFMQGPCDCHREAPTL